MGHSSTIRTILVFGCFETKNLVCLELAIYFLILYEGFS